MILLLGGTSETQPLALGLAEFGYRVLVSTATGIPFDTGDHPNILKRCGRLDEQGLSSLIEESGVRLIVDAVHPYASQARSAARAAADRSGIPCFTYLRPGTADTESVLHYAADHEDAARTACTFHNPILLTIGVKNLAPYVREARSGSIPLIVRVLPLPESVEACRCAGIPAGRIIASRGPFTVEENRAVIRRFSIGMLVTKDSGKEGGVPQKLEAARLENCPVVMVKRPKALRKDAFESITDLIAYVRHTLIS